MTDSPKIRPAVKLTTRLYLSAVAKHKTTALIALLNPLGAIAMSVIVPFFAGRALASLAAHKPGAANAYILELAVAAVLGIAANRIGFTKLMVLIANVMSDLQDKVIARLLARSTGYHSNQVSGKLVADAIEFVAAFNMMTGAIMINGLPFALIIISGLALVFANSMLLGFYLLTIVIITIIWAFLESHTRSSLRTERLAASRALTAHLSDTIVNAQTVKTFARERDEIARDLKLNRSLRDLRLSDWQRSGRSGSDRLAFLLIMQVILLFVVSKVQASNGGLAISFFAFTYVFTITSRLFSINDMLRQLEDAFLNASPIARMLSEDIEVTDIPSAKRLEVPHGAIKLDHVSFHYHDASSGQAVFSDLTLDIKAGERIGLIGPSGGGKSTLTRLLLRFDDIDAGSIQIDDQNIAHVTQTSLREAIAYVPQEPLLFHRTIRENIAYGRPKATEAEVKTASSRAYAKDFIEELPKGFDTVVGERGIKLSGGQRQRVAIARAILKDAPILILDEATSALDSESEIIIQKALWALMEDRTALVIAHRLSTIQKMDRIIVLDQGRIIEEGTHAQLLNQDGLYARLWHHQSGGFIADTSD